MFVRYLIQRIWQLIPVLILVSVAVFLIVRVIPGDPVLVMLGIDPDISWDLTARSTFNTSIG